MQILLIVTVLLLAWTWARPSFSQQPTEARQSIDEFFLFFPEKYPNGNWAPPDLRFQEVYFQAEDATQLHGWYCPCENPRAVILLSHGNAGHIASRSWWLQYLQSRLKVAVFAYDYRGYGRSAGKPTVAGVLQDARAARIKLAALAQVKETDIVLMGESLGGAVSVQLAAESPPKALILQSTFASLRDVAKVHFSRLAWVVPKNKLDSVTQIAKYQGPLLQSHGSRDRTVPLSYGRQLFDAANEPKQWVLVDNADHNDWLTPAYLKELDAFIQQIDDR